MNIDEDTRPTDVLPLDRMDAVALAGDDATAAPEQVRFDAVLKPAARFGPNSFLLFTAIFGTMNFIAGVAFLLVGPSPVFVVAALDILLVWYVFRMSYQTGRRYETVRLTEEALTVLRVTSRGKRQSYRFHPYWLQIELDDPPQADSPLILRSHGHEVEIGRFLTPEEKTDFARALRAELEAVNRLPAAS